MPRRVAVGQMTNNLYLYLKCERGKNNQFKKPREKQMQVQRKRKRMTEI